MASIPLGEFGQARAVPRTDNRRLDFSGLNRAGDGAAAIAEGLRDVAHVANQKLAEEKQQEDALSAAKAANAQADYELQVRAASVAELDNLGRGADYNTANDRYTEALSQIPPPQAAGLSPEMAERFNGGIARIRESGRLDVDRGVVKARADAGGVEWMRFRDTQGKLGAMPGANVEEVTARLRASAASFVEKFGLPASAVEGDVQRDIEGLWTNQAAQRFNTAGQDIAALEALKHDLEAEDGYYLTRLDPDKRVAMTASVNAQIGRVLASARVDADKREAVAVGVVKDVVAQAVSGVPPTPDMVATWQVAVAGTTQEGAFKDAIGQVVEVQQVRRMPPAAQQDWIAQREAALNTKGGTPQDKQRLATVRAALEADRKQQQDDPLQYLENMTGKAPGALPLNGLATGDVGPVTTAIADRVASLQALRAQGIPVAMKPLKTAEVTQLTQVISDLPSHRLLDLFGPLRSAAGDDDAYRAVMGQIAPGAPLKAYAGELAVRPGGRRAAELVLRGDELLAGKGDKAWKMPPAKDFEAAFLATSGNAYQGQPEALQRDLQAARAAYAAAASNTGDTDAMTDINVRAFDGAMRAVRGEIATIGGQQTIAPWGIHADDFEGESRPQIADALRAAGLDADADGIGLMSTDKPGRYVLMQGRSPVWNPNVKRADQRLVPVYIDFVRESQAVPPRVGVAETVRNDPRARGGR